MSSFPAVVRLFRISDELRFDVPPGPGGIQRRQAEAFGRLDRRRGRQLKLLHKVDSTMMFHRPRPVVNEPKIKHGEI
jgi:hypothetical protein